MKFLLFVFCFLLFSSTVSTAQQVAEVECSYELDPTCITLRDENLNGTMDSTPPATMFQAATGGYVVALSSCMKVGPFVSEADASSTTGTVVGKPTGTSWLDGEIACSYDVPADNYYLTGRMRNGVGPRALWARTVSSHTASFQNTDLSIIPQINPYNWHVLDTTGEPRVFALSGKGAFYLKAEALVQFDCWFLTTDLLVAQKLPICPGETGSLSPDYVILEKGAETAPVAWNSAAFTHANVMQLAGFTSSPTTPICGGTLTVKMLWDDAATDRGYLSANCADTVATTLTTSNDQASMPTAAEDKIDFRWKSNLSQAIDTSLFGVIANLQPAFADFGHTAEGVRDFTTSLNTTVVRNIVSSTSWNIFMAFDWGFNAAPDLIARCNLLATDTDADGVRALKHFHGTTSNAQVNLSEYGLCQWSSVTVAASGGAGDLTDADVDNFAVSQIQPTSAQGTATTNEPGTCRIHARTSAGVTPANATHVSGGQPSSAGTCQDTLLGLSASTTYFAVMCVHEPSDRVGCSGDDAENEVSFTTGGTSTAHLFVDNASFGTEDCLSFANRCQTGSVWSKITSTRRIIEFAAGTNTNKKVYAGAANVQRVPVGTNGTQANPIILRCAVDGGCLMDTAVTFSFDGNEWIEVHGFDIRNMDISITCSRNITFKRTGSFNVLGSGAPGGIGVNGCGPGSSQVSSNIVFEDAYGWGGRRLTCSFTQRADNSTFRRTFCLHTGTAAGPSSSYQITYNNYGNTVEDSIAMSDKEVTQTEIAQWGFFAMESIKNQYENNAADNYCSDTEYRNSIGIAKSGHNSSPRSYGYAAGGLDCVRFNGITFYKEGHATINALDLLAWSPCNDGTCVFPSQGDPPVGDRVASNITRVSTGAAWPADQFSGAGVDRWNVATNHHTFTSVASMLSSQNILQDSANPTGARFCKRHINRVKQSTGIFEAGKWPMEDRIAAALTLSGRDPSDYFGTTAHSNNELIGVWFADTFGNGTIPAECNSVAPPPPPPQNFTLLVNKAGDGVGTVTSNPAGINCGGDCTESYVSGTVVVLTPTASPGSVFASWTGSGCSTGTVTMNADTTCTATFNTAPPPPPGALYAVSSGGATSGTCSIKTPCTLPFLLGATSPAVAGDTIVLNNGTYNGNFNTGKGGSAGQPITLKALNQHQAILTATQSCASSAETAGLTIDVGHWTIDGIRMNQQTRGIYITAAGVTVQNSIVEDMTETAIRIENAAANGTVIDSNVLGYAPGNCIVPNRDDAGIYSRQTDNIQITNNAIIGTGDNSYQWLTAGTLNGYGILLTQNTDNHLVQGNLFVGQGGKGIFRILVGTGFTGANSIIRDNVVIWGEGGGLSSSDCAEDSNSFINNLAVGNFFELTGTKGNGGGFGHHIWDHNTLIQTPFTRIGTALGGGGGCGGTKIGLKFKNNLAIATYTPTGSVHAVMYIDTNNSFLSGDGGEKNNNLFWNPGSSANRFRIYTPAATDIQSQPTFVDDVGGDFTLVGGSAGKNGATDGTDIGIAYNAHLRKNRTKALFAYPTTENTGLTGSTSTSFTGLSTSHFYLVHLYAGACLQTAEQFTIEGVSSLKLQRNFSNLVTEDVIQPTEQRYITLGRHKAIDGTLNISWQTNNCVERIHIRKLPTADEAFSLLSLQ